MNRRVLLVDDEQNVLDAFRRNLRKFDITTALGPIEGLEHIESGGPFAVVVSDLQMPHMDGIEFLTKVEALEPETIRIMLTGQADLNVSIAAVNEGHVFRFLTKPCPPDLLAATLDDALEQHRLIEAERSLLEDTLHGAVAMLTDILGFVDTSSQVFATLVEADVARLCETVGLDDWQFRLAAMLSQLGNMTLPPETVAKLNRGAPLTPSEAEMAKESPEVAYRLLRRIPRLEGVAEMVRLQSNPPDYVAGSDDLVAAGANVLDVAVTYHRLNCSDREQREVQAIMEQAATSDFRRALVAELLELGTSVEYRSESLSVRELQAGMILDQIVRANNGTMLLAEGQTLTSALLERLRVFAHGVGVEQPIRVLTESTGTGVHRHDEEAG